MSFVRCFLDDEGQPMFVVEANYPLQRAGISRPDGALYDFVDIGLVEGKNWKTLIGEPCSVSRHIFERLEKHPAADDHADAPKVRFKAAVQDVPEVTFCPADFAAIKAHLAVRGLPTRAVERLKPICACHSAMTARELKMLGFSFLEIRSLPRFANARADAQRKAASEKIAKAENAAQSSKAEKTQTRLLSKLSKRRGDR